MGGTVSLYDALKARKTGLSPDLYTLLRAQREMPERVITAEPPIYFKSDGTAISEYQISGDTIQSGTPTPDNPIEVLGVGDKTGNLYNINAHDTTNGYANNMQLSEGGTVTTWGSAEISEYISISGDTAYTFNGIGSYNSPCYALYDENKQLIGAYKYNGRSIINFISPSNARYFRFTHIKATTSAMMVEGTYTSSTMPKFEPYGYKIPITLNSVTQNIYLDSPLYEGDYIKRNADGTGVLHQDGADTSITLPQLSTVKGNNELNISTTVTPEVTLKGKIKQLPDSNMNALLSVMEEM